MKHKKGAASSDLRIFYACIPCKRGLGAEEGGTRPQFSDWVPAQPTNQDEARSGSGPRSPSPILLLSRSLLSLCLFSVCLSLLSLLGPDLCQSQPPVRQTPQSAPPTATRRCTLPTSPAQGPTLFDALRRRRIILCLPFHSLAHLLTAFRRPGCFFWPTRLLPALLPLALLQ